MTSEHIIKYIVIIFVIIIIVYIIYAIFFKKQTFDSLIANAETPELYFSDALTRNRVIRSPCISYPRINSCV